MRTLFRYIRPKVWAISLGFCIKFGGTVAELLLPWMLSVILDRYVPARDLRMVWIWGGWMVVFALLAMVFNVMANRMATATSRDVIQSLRHDLFQRVLELSCVQEDGFTTPSLVARLTSDTYNVHRMVDRMQRLGVRAPILLLGGIAITITLEPALALVLIAMLPLLGLVVWLISGKGTRLYTKTQTALDRMMRRAQESMAGVRVIQALSRTSYEVEQFDQANQELVGWEQRADRLMNLSSPLINLLLNTGLTLVIVVGAFRVNAGFTQPGTIIAFLSYFTIILNALMMVSRLFVMYAKGAASARRIAEVLEAPKDMPVEPAHTPVQDDALIRFENVSFSYGKGANNLSQVNFALQKGETLGVIGPTGSGKSTLVALLLRHYDPDSGRILLAGQDLKTIPPQQLYAQFGVVFQNDFLFADAIGENIRFGRSLEEAQLRQAACTAQADFIWEEKSGFGEELAAKGSNLSGGQKQRLLLARALAANPAILVLDDSSSALDYKTDAALRHALTTRLRSSTKIIVAQRVSSICHADHILMLDGGRVAGYGTHAQLLESCPAYREIAQIQMGEVE